MGSMLVRRSHPSVSFELGAVLFTGAVPATAMRGQNKLLLPEFVLAVI